MPINQVNKSLNQNLYFITPTIKNWYYIFDRHDRWHIIADSLIYCQKYKNLEIYSYVFMLNHLHLIIRCDDVIGFLRDFKRFTSRELLKNIKRTEPRVLELFRLDDRSYGFWKKDNQPKLLESDGFIRQKVNYILNYGVLNCYVQRPECWKWSSANPDSKIEVDGLVLF